MENFTIGVSLQSDRRQTLSNGNSTSSVSASASTFSAAVSSSSKTSSSSSKAFSKSSSSSLAFSSDLFMSSTSSSSSSVTFRTHYSSSPSPAAITSAVPVTTLSSSPSENSSILTFPVVSNASNWNDLSTSYNFPVENATLKVEKGFPAGGIAGIVVGGFVFLVIMIIVVVCLCRTCRRSEKYGNCFKSKVNNRQSYEVNELPSKASSVKKVFNEFSDSFSRRGETRIDEEVPRCSEPTTDQSEVPPPPVPRRDATTKRDNGDSQQSPQHYSTASYVSPSVAAFDPTSENGSGELESFPDELPPPPPRDSFLVLDS